MFSAIAFFTHRCCIISADHGLGIYLYTLIDSHRFASTAVTYLTLHWPVNGPIKSEDRVNLPSRDDLLRAGQHWLSIICPDDLLGPHSGMTADQTVTCKCLVQSTLFVHRAFLFNKMDLAISVCLAFHRSYVYTIIGTWSSIIDYVALNDDLLYVIPNMPA